MTTVLSVSQRRVLELLAGEAVPVKVTATLCTPGSLNSLARRHLIRGGARGWRITKQGRELLDA
jgi:hypothetical protein